MEKIKSVSVNPSPTSSLDADLNSATLPKTSEIEKNISTLLLADPMSNLHEMPDQIKDLSATSKSVFLEYLNGLQELLHVSHWKVVIDWEENCHNTCDGQLAVTTGRYSATLWLHNNFFTLPLVDQRRVLVHELLHIHTDKILSSAAAGFKQLSKDTKAVVTRLTREAEEYTVDALSEVLAQFVPLPPWAAKT